MLSKKRALVQLGQGVNEKSSVGPSSYGKRLLEGMGWKQGAGAGKYEQGVSEHVRVTRRSDEMLGLGAAGVDGQGKTAELMTFDPAKIFANAASMFDVPSNSFAFDDMSSLSSLPASDNDVGGVEGEDLSLFDLAAMTAADRKLFIRCNGRMLGQRSHPRMQKGKLQREKMAREKEEEQARNVNSEQSSSSMTKEQRRAKRKEKRRAEKESIPDDDNDDQPTTTVKATKKKRKTEPEPSSS